MPPVEEYVSVVGTNAFMDFVESFQAEGVVLERKPMGEGKQPKTPLVVEVDQGYSTKDLEVLDIEIPLLTPRVYQEYKNLSDLDVGAMGHQRMTYVQFSEAEQHEIVFKDITTGEVTHTTLPDTAGVADYRSVIGYFAQAIMKDLRLVGGYGDSHFELMFARFLEDCDDVVSYAKNYLAVHFKLDYVNADGDISNYYPDFLVKLPQKRLVIVETKGQEDLEVPLKMQRLQQWCEDLNRVQTEVAYDFVYVDQESFERHRPTAFRQLVEGFREFKEKALRVHPRAESGIDT